MLISVLALLSTVNAVTTPGSVDSVATKAALMAADQALSDRAQKEGPRVFLTALDGSAAVLFPGQPILSGRQASKAFMARYDSPSS